MKQPIPAAHAARTLLGRLDMRLGSIVAALAATLWFGSGAIAQIPSETPATKPTASAAAPVTPTPTPSLNKADVDAWLDGFMPYALSAGDIPGAVVVVVKDGKVLTERGFGYADIKSGRKVDPKTTLFRPGSISKTFVWTAVMQLVEQGKIDLDADIQTYLDFKVYGSQPITMRNLMTHQPGYEEHLKQLFVSSPSQMTSLRDFLVRYPPAQVFKPGTTPTYSNYGAVMAGYIVQRVSGEKFDDYMDRHVFGPLGMRHATFRQPLPARFKPDMATAYKTASSPALPYELVNGEPAGSMSVSGDDMGRYMIAHLHNGAAESGRILQEATARQMHSEQKELFPPTMAFTLGFPKEDTNGHVIIGHSGGTGSFMSNMHLFLNDDVGVFVSVNGPGKDAAFARVHEMLYRDFADRYFPADHPLQPAIATALEHGKALAGTYWPSRREQDTFFQLAAMVGQTKITVDADGTLHVGEQQSLSGAPKTWHEVGPWLWQDNDGLDRLKAIVKDGKVTGYVTDSMRAANVMQRVPGWALASWNGPLLAYCIAVLLVMLVLWPVQAIVRRAHGESFPLSGRRAMLYRLSRASAIVQLAGLAAYGVILSGGLNVYHLDDTLNGSIRLGQLLCLLGVIGAVIQVWSMAAAWTARPSSWWAKLSTLLVAIAGLAFVWFVFTQHLLGPSTQF